MSGDTSDYKYCDQNRESQPLKEEHAVHMGDGADEIDVQAPLLVTESDMRKNKLDKNCDSRTTKAESDNEMENKSEYNTPKNIYAKPIVKNTIAEVSLPSKQESCCYSRNVDHSSPCFSKKSCSQKARMKNQSLGVNFEINKNISANYVPCTELQQYLRGKCSSKNKTSVYQHIGELTTGCPTPPSDPSSKHSSNWSLNTAWKKNYVPFINPFGSDTPQADILQSTIPGKENSCLPTVVSTEPLLAQATSPGADGPNSGFVKATHYKVRGITRRLTSLMNWFF